MPGVLDGVAVLFDLDGTLIDTAGDLCAAMNHTLIAAGLAPLPVARVRHLIGHGARTMLMHGMAEQGAASPRGMTREDFEPHVDLFIEYYTAHIAEHSRPFDGALQAVEALRRDGASVAICTNKREPLARRLIDALDLTDVFPVIVGADPARPAKPDPDPVQRCLLETGASLGVFVGDSDTDIGAAVAAGLPCLAATFGYGPLARRAEAFALFDRFSVTPALVRDAAARA